MMRITAITLLTLIVIGLVTVGCRESENGAYKHRLNQTNAVKPIKELTPEEQKVVGEYEIKKDRDTYRVVLLENGNVEAYLNGKKREEGNGKKREEGKWEITKEGELHITSYDGITTVSSINKDGSITLIADIDADGERKDLPKDKQETAKKIN